ncbi:MAG: ABC transporter permease [Gemmatimonadota bacterium]
MDQLRQDLRFALRQMGRAPAFTLLATLTLALGIGANAAIFSVVQGVVLRPLPFAQAERMVLLYTGYPDDDTRYSLSAPDFMSYHDDARSFAGVTAVSATQQALTGVDEPAWVRVGRVAADFFGVLGVDPVLGRTFGPHENTQGNDAVVVLTHAYWQSRFGGSPDALGQTLILDGILREVVGVLPPEFDFPAQTQMYFPLAYNERFSSSTSEGRRSEYLTVVARMAPGVSLEEAAAEVDLINSRLQSEFPQTNSENIRISLVPLRDHLLGDVRTPLLILLGAVGLVLLMACVNVANLLLSRATARRGELAVRTALGAGRRRIVQQLLTESLLLGVLGGGAGLLLATWATPLLVALSPEGIPRLESIRVDGGVVVFTAAVSLLTGILFGLLPALHGTRGSAQGLLRDGGSGALGGRTGNDARRTLVVAELAFAVVLLVGAGLLIRSFLGITSVDPGFRTDGMVFFSLSLPASSYETGASIQQFYPLLLERIEGLPGVEAAAAGSDIPLGGSSSILGFSIENREPPLPGFVLDAVTTATTPGYFSVLGIPLQSGRFLDSGDRGEAAEVLVVNQAFVARYFPDEEPLGQRISFGDDDEWMEIVGVVGNAPQHGLHLPVRPAAYVPHEWFTARSMILMVRTTGESLALTNLLRTEVATLNPSLPIRRFLTGEDLVAETVAQPRFYTVLLGIFGGVALILAAVGTFGVISYMATQRTREFGIRVALGAEPGAVQAMVLRQGAWMGVAGVGTGLLAAGGASRLLEGMLYDVGALDPVAFLSVAALLLGVALLASYLPARRATRVEPMVALRAE